MEFVNFLKNPQQYMDLGAKIPKGAILTGKNVTADPYFYSITSVINYDFIYTRTSRNW